MSKEERSDKSRRRRSIRAGAGAALRPEALRRYPSLKAVLSKPVHVISRQGFMLATNDFYWLSSWAFLRLIGGWFAKRAGGGSAASGGGE